MALSSEQQFQLELEQLRHVNQIEIEKKRMAFEAIRLAKETLIEVNRNKSFEESSISPEDIITFAKKLITSVDE